MMKCVICKHGETNPGNAIVTLHREGTIVVVKEVPADICDNCGEYYLSREVTKVLMDKAEKAAANGAEVEIIRFAA
jgi:YgiT-type zinc finger domain-containing protein